MNDAPRSTPDMANEERAAIWARAAGVTLAPRKDKPKRSRRSWILLIATVLSLCAVLTLCNVRWARPTQRMIVAQPSTIRRSAPATKQGGVDPNTASLEELQQLHGVGPKLAQAIIDEREANGAFFYLEDLTRVKGVGASTLAGMIDQLCITQP